MPEDLLVSFPDDDSRPSTVVIAYLMDHPEHVGTIAAWIFDEWQDLIEETSAREVQERVRQCLQRDRLPLTLIALQDGVPVGTASLYPQDLPVRPELGPWLAAVYVPAEQRGKGIGSRLVQAAEQAARLIGISRLYLFTPDQELFYCRLGWQVQEYTAFAGENIVVMSKWLGDASADE